MGDVKSVMSLLLMISVVEAVSGSQCTSSYQQLQAIFRSNSENYDNISEAFYVTNRVSSRYVVVNYQVVECASYQWDSDNFTGCTTVGTEQWIWSHSVVHLLFHPYSLYYLSLRYDDTNDRTNMVHVTVPVVCRDKKERLLSRLTQLLRRYASNPQQTVTFNDDNPGRSFKVDSAHDDFNRARVLCICMSFSTALVILLVGIQIANRSRRKLSVTLSQKKHANVLYSFALVWFVDIMWIGYLDYKVIFEQPAWYIPDSIYSIKCVYFIVAADILLVALILVITPFLSKDMLFQQTCKISSTYTAALKSYIVISTFLIFAVIHGSHIIFILFGYLAEPIHAMAKLIEFVTAIAYFISIFTIVFQTENKYKGQRGQILHYTKLCFKLLYFYLYFLILFFVFSYLLYHDLMVTEYQSLIKSISISTLIWLVTISLHYSYRWSGTPNTSTSSSNITTDVLQHSQHSREGMVQSSNSSLVLSNQMVPTVHFLQKRNDRESLIDKDSFDV